MRAISILFSGILFFNLTALAHDLDYTLVQDGAKKVAICSSETIYGMQLDVFNVESSSEGYLILTIQDKGSNSTQEYIMKTQVSQHGHDSQTYKNQEALVEMTFVGEGPTPLKFTLRQKSSALKVWLKTYSELKSNYNFMCHQL